MKRRSNVPPQAYKRTGTLAVHPQAFLELFMMPESRENEERDGVAIVDVCGPLTQHDEGFFDSYEAIRARVQAACDSAAAAVVLRIDSPGGDVAGCFDTSRAIRAMCAAAKKPLWAHVDGKACSAGYALAAAANEICLGDTGIVGSIGVIAARADVSALNAAQGIRIALVASGARKADGNPDQPLTDAELKATQELVDSMAAAFFELVAELRGVPAAAVAGLQAGVFHGDAAKRAGLADQVVSFEAMLAAIASGGTVMSDYEEGRAALEKAAKGDDANAAAAKRALAAMDDEPKTEPDGDEPPKDDKKESAEGEPAKTDEDDKDKDKPAAAASGNAAASADIALKALAKVNQLEAQLKSEKLKSERDALLASRPDLPAELLPVLRAASLATVREYINGLPAPKASAAKPALPKPAATATVTGTRGAGQGGPQASPPAEVAALDRAMGLTTSALGVRRQGNALIFGVHEVPAAQSAPAGGAK